MNKYQMVILFLFMVIAVFSFAQTQKSLRNPSLEQVKHLKDFEVIEFRRYTIREEERKNFARYFESYFPEAFEQLGAIAFGQFFERDNNSGFTWIRGFKNMDARAIINAQFYYGPLWREHGKTMNKLMIDSDNVMLLRPISPDRGIAVLPAVDPVSETEGARGVIVAQVFAVRPEKVEAFAHEAEDVFYRYRAAGVREAGVLVTLDSPNNFPQLPVRTDGPFLVWLGILKDNEKLDSVLRPLVERSLPLLSATGFLRNTAEFIVLDPTHRSRLRWISEDNK